MNKEKVAVIIGRFQPITLEQIERVFRPALEENELVIVILGSSNTSRDFVNPFTSSIRENMIRQALIEKHPTLSNRILLFRSIRDYWTNRVRFLTAIQDSVSSCIKETFGQTHRLSDHKITLYGVDRNDSSSEYLSHFPTWESRVEIDESIDSAQDIMTQAYKGDDSWTADVARSTCLNIYEWLSTAAGSSIIEEYEHNVRYRAKYDPLEKQAGHVLQFMTVDNVVIHKGHILLVRRRSQPGKGLWALPGGFLESYETTIAGAKRELREETRLRVSDEWLTKSKHFDYPYRSRRGRTLTFAYKWEIPDWKEIPQLSPDNGFEREVTKVQWFPLSEVINDMSSLLFEDHLDIIEELAY